MSGDWQVTGGAGGITARTDDLLRLASLYSEAAGVLATAAGQVAGMAASTALVESAMLSPGTLASVGGHLLDLELRSDGVAATAVELAALAGVLRSAAHAYEAAEAALSTWRADLEAAAGTCLGVALPVLVMPTVLTVLDVETLLTLPTFTHDLTHGRASWADLPGRVLSATEDDISTELLLHPAAVQELAAALPGLESGLLCWVGRPGGVLPRDYRSALRDLGRFFPDGSPDVGRGGPAQLGDHVAPTTLSQLLLAVNRRQSAPAVSGEIGILTLTAPDGTRRYVVELPGTESWALRPGTVVRDLSTNVHGLAGQPTAYARGVALALDRAGIGRGAPVLLVGHSQGGVAAAALAATPDFRSRFLVSAVVTAGAPIGGFAIPRPTQVLAIENRADLVPQLDGAANPDRPNETTLTFSAGRSGVGTSHNLARVYVPAAAKPPVGDPSYDAWERSAAGFLDADNRAALETYAIRRIPSPRSSSIVQPLPPTPPG